MEHVSFVHRLPRLGVHMASMSLRIVRSKGVEDVPAGRSPSPPNRSKPTHGGKPRLETRLRCPMCGSRDVRLIFTVPREAQKIVAQIGAEVKALRLREPAPSGPIHPACVPHVSVRPGAAAAPPSPAPRPGPTLGSSRPATRRCASAPPRGPTGCMRSRFMATARSCTSTTAGSGCSPAVAMAGPSGSAKSYAQPSRFRGGS